MEVNMKTNKITLLKSVLSIVLAITLVSSVFLTANAKKISTEKEEKVSKISDALLEKIQENSNSNQEIPIVIWYNDINHSNVEKEAEEQTKISADDLSAISENTDINSISDMNQYLKKTEKSRKQEQKKADNYIKAKREISKEKYIKSVDKITKKLSLSKNSIIFESKFAPMIIANVKTKDIDKISKCDTVNNIDYYVEPKTELPDKASISKTTGYDELISKVNLTGNGVKVGLVEVGYPTEDSELDLSKITNVGNVGSRAHAANTAKILVGSNTGFAPGIDLYSTNASFDNIETMLSLGVQLINVSFGWLYSENDTTSNYAESYYDRWFNHIVAYHNVTVVASSGNDAQGTTYKRVLSPAMASNVIAVGAYNDQGTSEKSDDVIYDYSSYKDGNGDYEGVQKPDCIMPGNIAGGGTSSSAPVLTAMLSLMFELKPSLALYPQAVKAIVTSSCNRKVKSSSTMSDGETMPTLTEKQGAGAPDVMLMADIICQGTYGIGTISANENTDSHRFLHLPYGATKLNAAISWLKEVNEDSNLNIYNEIVDLDLNIYNNDSLLASCGHEYTSSEIVTTAFGSSGNYTLEAEKYTENFNEQIRYGYAYCSADKTYSTTPTQEGIYYLKDYKGNYLTLDDDNNLVLSQFTGEINQQWIFKSKGKRYGYYISPASGNLAGGIGIDKSLAAPYVASSKISDKPIDFKIYDFEYSGNQDGKAFLYSSNSNYYFTSSIKTPYIYFKTESELIPTSDSYFWSLEKVNYHIGDVDLNGNISENDAELIQKYCVDLTDFNNLQKYLADVDKDGRIDILDATAIQKQLAGY